MHALTYDACAHVFLSDRKKRYSAIETSPSCCAHTGVWRSCLQVNGNTMLNLVCSQKFPGPGRCPSGRAGAARSPQGGAGGLRLRLFLFVKQKRCPQPRFGSSGYPCPRACVGSLAGRAGHREQHFRVPGAGVEEQQDTRLSCDSPC